MSSYGMTLTVLATGLAEAVLKDEAPEVGGFDLSAGMYGPNVSDWLRSVARQLDGDHQRDTTTGADALLDKLKKISFKP